MRDTIKSDDEIAEGFSEQEVWFFDKENETISRLEIILPNTPIIKELVKEFKEIASTAKGDYLKNKFEEMQKKENDKKSNQISLDDDKDENSIKKKKKTRIEDLIFSEEKMEIEVKYNIDIEANKNQFWAELYVYTEPLKIIENIGSKSNDPDSKKRAFESFNFLKAKGNFRVISNSKLSYEERLKSLAKLDDTHPNFETVTALIKEQLALSNLQEKPLHVPPLLLFGPPGVGKTDYSKTLAEIIGVPIHRIGFDTGITDSTLTGSASHWGNTTPGVLFDKLVLGDFCNPIFLLDEIDKCGAFGGRDATKPLHTILEPSTSKHTVDISIGFEFDTSLVCWIATANNPAMVLDSLRSRFVEFHIEYPKGAQALQLAQTIALKAHATLGVSDLEPVDPQLVKLLAHMTAREQLQALRRAYSSAVANGRKAVEKTDFPADVFADSDPNSSYLH